MKECKNCMTMLEDDEMFCHECGAKQEIKEAESRVEEQVALEGKKCIHCGELIEVDSMFCPFCGKSQAEEEKLEVPQRDSIETEPKQSKESEPVASPQPEPAMPEEEPTIEEEEKKKSKAWLWILLVLLIAGGSGWYFLSGNNYGSEVVTPVENVMDSEEEVPDYEETKEDAEVDPSSKQEFLERFYHEGRLEADYIKQRVTPEVINRLRQDYGSDCNYGDCLGTWVFLASPQGADARIVDGPFISETSQPGIFKVDYVYSYNKDSGKSNEKRTVYLTVVKSDGKYLISGYELEDYSSKDDNTLEEDTTVPDGSITMAGKVSSYGIHMVLDVNGTDVSGYYYYDSQGSGNRVTLKGSITEGILTLYKYDADGNNTGHFEGAFNQTSYQGKNVNYTRDEALPFSVEKISNE